MTLIRRLARITRILEQQSELIDKQAQFINLQEHRIQRLHLDYLNEIHGLVAGWLISIEQPEVDVRDDLAELEQQIAHRAAVLQEHIL